MRISGKYKIHQVADQFIVLLLGTEKNQVIHLKGSSKYLWDSLKEQDFEAKDVANLLLEKYEVTPHQAEEDAKKWITQLKELGIIIL